MVSKPTLNLFLITIAIHYLHSQPLSPKSQLLTPSNPITNGINLTTSTSEVIATPTNEWNITINSQTTYQFIISLDSTWGFHPSMKSLIKLTINSPTIASPSTFDDIVFGFTTNNKQYISTWIPMDNNGQKNRIYPKCDRSSNPIASLGIGNIGTLPKTDRNCDVANGSCNNWNTMHPKNAQYPTTYEYNTFPITFTLENNPMDNKLFLYFNTISYKNGFTQTCGFVSMNTNEGLNIYFGGHDNGQRFTISSFLIESFFNISNPFIPHNTNENISILNEETVKLDENNNSNGSDIGVVIGIIIGLFIVTTIGALLHIKYGMKEKVNENIKDDENSISENKNDIEEVKRMSHRNIRKYSEGNHKGVTGENIRWHNLNALPMDNSQCCDGYSNETNDVIPPPVYQIE